MPLYLNMINRTSNSRIVCVYKELISELSAIVI